MNSQKKSDKMKKNYIQPESTINARYALECSICNATVQRKADWGGSGKYANPDWHNQNYGDDPVVIAGDDNGALNSMTKGRGGDWGDIW